MKKIGQFLFTIFAIATTGFTGYFLLIMIILWISGGNEKIALYFGIALIVDQLQKINKKINETKNDSWTFKKSKP